MSTVCDDELPVVPYEDIPLAVRLMLGETYAPNGVEIWWNARNRLLDNQRPCTRWNTRPEDVLMIADLLASGGYA